MSMGIASRSPHPHGQIKCRLVGLLFSAQRNSAEPGAKSSRLLGFFPPSVMSFTNEMGTGFMMLTCSVANHKASGRSRYDPATDAQ